MTLKCALSTCWRTADAYVAYESREENKTPVCENHAEAATDANARLVETGIEQ